uniref:Histone-lysine N-methyltransferase SETMAR n=1 Tax=Strongyloides papillosus TaxID=174720 RepID=A0A0N5CCU2_STREA
MTSPLENCNLEEQRLVTKFLVLERLSPLKSILVCLSNVIEGTIHSVIQNKLNNRKKGVKRLDYEIVPHPPYSSDFAPSDFYLFGYEIVPHPPYSSDFAPSDFYLFGPLKDSLRGVKFNNNGEIKEEIQKWLRSEDKNFFATGIRKLVERWDKCINVADDYVEKRVKFGIFTIINF